MATVSSEAYMLHLLCKAEQSRHELNKKKTMIVELRTLEFWRAIIAECLATFMYVFLVCGSHVMWPLHSVNTLTKSFTNGFAMATAAHCFGHISGAHVNPAFTFAMLITQKITPLRTFLYITAQCGGAIAGAALLYGWVPEFCLSLRSTELNFSYYLNRRPDNCSLAIQTISIIIINITIIITIFL